MMKSKLFLIVSASLGVLLLGALGFFFFKNQQAENLVSIPLDGATTTPNYSIELEPGIDLQALAPSLDRAIQFSDNTPPQVRVIIEKKFAEVAARLKKDVNRADDWFTLGVLYHSASDYEGARDVWEFLTKVIQAPDVATVYENLGKLYKFNLKDFPKSEMYLKKAISAKPDSISPYFELHELYRYLYKTDTTAAVDILVTASTKFPTNADPLVLLGNYYRDHRDFVKAKDAYSKALDLARKGGNVAQIDAISAELANVSK